MAKNQKNLEVMGLDREVVRKWDQRQLDRFYYEAPVITESRKEESNLNNPSDTSPDQNLEFGLLCFPNPNNNMNKIVLNPEVRQTLENGINKLKLKDFLNNNWDLKSVEPLEGKNIFNFYGLPGTGKTLTAKAIASILNKPILIVDYSQVESKWVGNTEKNIASVFELAKKHDAIILFDEADTLASQRIEENTSQARHINSSRNVFMQEIDRFNGMIIMTTNLFKNFDPALLRRINQHIKFELPDEAARKTLFQKHIPSAVPLSEDFSFDTLAKESKNFSGGDIKNAVLEAMVASATEGLSSGNVEGSVLTLNHVLSEIKKIVNSKNNHSGESERKVMGIRGDT